MKNYLLSLLVLSSLYFIGCSTTKKIVNLYEDRHLPFDSIAIFTGDPVFSVRFLNTDSMNYKMKPRFHELKKTIYQLLPGYHTLELDLSSEAKTGDSYNFLELSRRHSLAFHAVAGHKYHLFHDFYSIHRSYFRIEDITNKSIKDYQLDTIKFDKSIFSYSPSKVRKFTNNNNSIKLGNFKNEIGYKNPMQIGKNKYLPISVSKAIETSLKMELQNLGFYIGESNIEINGAIKKYGKKDMEISFSIKNLQNNSLIFEDTYFSNNSFTCTYGEKDNNVRILRDCILDFLGFPEFDNPIQKLLLYCTESYDIKYPFDSLTLFSGTLRTADKERRRNYQWLISDSLKYYYPYWYKTIGDTAIIGYTDCYVSYILYHYYNPINFHRYEVGDTIDEKYTYYLSSLAGLFPLYGIVTQVNKNVIDNPLLIYHDPYGAGWLFKMKISDKSRLSMLLSSKQFEKFVRKKVLIE